MLKSTQSRELQRVKAQTCKSRIISVPSQAPGKEEGKKSGGPDWNPVKAWRIVGYKLVGRDYRWFLNLTLMENVR